MIKRLKKITAVILVVMTLCSIIIPSGITELFKREVEAYGAFTLGTSGSLSASQARSARSGIMSEAFREPPIRVSLYRNEKVSYDKSKEEILSEMSRGQPENLTGSMYFLTSYSVSDFRNRPVSIGEANVSSKSLTYYSTEDDLNNLIIMENNPNIGTVKSAKGVYYKLMNNNYDDFVDKWETYANDASYKDMSKQVWSYIFKQDSAHGYHVEDRINEIFNPDNYDKESENLTEEQTKELRYHYIDILMTLYSISSGRQKAEWKAAVNDYINVENLDESPISVCIDSAVVMVLYDLDSTGRLLVLPTIDYLNYVAGVETQFAMNGVAWWGNKPVSSRHKGDSEAQLLDSVQESLNASPTFQRITDSVSQSNGFSWGLSALLSGRLSTANGVASIDYSSVEQEYFKIFKMDAAQGLPDKMYGYMLLIGTEAEVKTPDRADLKLKLIAQPDNKVVTDKVLGEAVKLDLWSDCEAKDISELKRLIDNNDDDTYILTIVWHRACPVLGYARSEVPSQIVETLSGSEFLRFIRGEYSISAVDDVASINVEAYKNKKIEFNYEAKLTIQNSQAEYIIIKDSKTGDVVPSKDTASYVIQGEKIGYTSKPEAYSELKNYGAGSNTSGTLKESYEAMAGIPSTEQLYLAAGGSEFVVEVTVEYVENEVAKRTYHSHYDGTDCEFKAGDTAQNYTVPSPSGASSSSLTANVHSGGTVTATWTGTRKWTGSETHYDHGGSVVNTWDDSLYNAALQQANAWITSVNSHKIYHKAASDGVNRVFNGWNAKITVNSKLNGSPAWYNPGQPFVPPSYDEEGNMISAGQPYVPSSGAKGTAGSYTITVTATLPAHCICGPCCSHKLPEINDTWAQTFEYDTMKISDVHVWTIDQAAVDGMKEITSVDVIGADIITGRPNIFYNIALKNDENYVAQDGKGGATGSSLAGRIRYSYEPKQHDEVYLDNGTRTNKCDGLSKTYASNTTQAGGGGHTHAWAKGFIYNNFKPSASTSGATRYAGHLNYPTNTANYLQNNTDAKDKSTTEYSKFLSQRNTTVKATMITDFLILQTSSGDQSVLYYHKDSQTVKSEVKIPAIDVTEKTMWDDNVNSAAKWEANEINVGGYNGNYTDVTNKFKGTGSNEKVATFVDVDPANKIVRPTRPSTRLMLYKGAINIILGNRNKSYMTGEAEVFWANSLHWTDTSSPYFAGVTNSSSIAVYPTGDKIGPNTGYNFGTLAHYIPEGPNTGGFTILAPYSKEHSKINDIIVHDPVSTEYAHTISLDESRDQRTGETLGSAEDIIGDLNELKVCPREPGLCDFRVLNCTYFQDTVLLDMDFDTVDSSNNPINKKTGNAFLLPNNFTLTTNSTLSSNRVLDAKGTRLGIPFSELGIDYRNPTHLLVEADILMSKQSTSSMIFSFYKYDVFVPANQQYIVINTGNGEELKVAKNIADGKKHHIAVDFSFNNAESCKVYVDGVEVGLERVNESSQISSALVGKYLYIGSWGYDNNYPAKFMLDNLKVTRLAGTNHHTEDCYRYVEVNLPGEGMHEHSAACVNSKTGQTGKGAEWVVQEYLEGRLTDQQLKDIVGENIYNLIKDGMAGSVIYTWKNWTSSNMQGFATRKDCSLSATGNNLVINSTGTDPKFEVPVDIESSGVARVVVTLDNNTASTNAEMYWKTDKSTTYTVDKRVSYTMKANTANQEVIFDVRGISTWKDKITGLNFDLATTTGKVTVKKIEVYGKGTLLDAGGGSGGVVWQSGVAKQHTVSLTPGNYKFEVWGAQGGSYNSYTGGKGAYSVGMKKITSNTTVYVNVGGQGVLPPSGTQAGGFNGGGLGYSISTPVPIPLGGDGYGMVGSAYAASGGGASDIRIGGSALDNRVIVASGGAGGGYADYDVLRGQPVPGHPNGGVIVKVGEVLGGYAGYAGNIGNSNGTKGTGTSINGPAQAGAGGGGYYGGQAPGTSNGSGGTSYIGGVTSSSGVTASTIAGNTSMPNPSGGTMTGKTGNGYVRITSHFSPVKITMGTDASIEKQYSQEGLYSVTLEPGKYLLEVWGASGGSLSGAPGGKGGYATGVYETLEEVTAYIAVGGTNSGLTGGYNGGGDGKEGTISGSSGGVAFTATIYSCGGGGSTDIRIGSSGVGSRIIAAGGGAGGSKYSGVAGGIGPDGPVYGSISGSTAGGHGGLGPNNGILLTGDDGLLNITSNGSLGGGAGGGMHGGQPGRGGTNYVNTNMTDRLTKSGNASMPSPSGGTMVGNSGCGYAKIKQLESYAVVDIDYESIIKDNWTLLPETLPNGSENPIWACDPSDAGYYTSYGPSIVIEQYILSCNESHHKGMHYDISNKTCWQACFNDENHKHYKEEVNTTDGSFVPGNFINMDYEFEVYFPNRGDFNEGQSNGIGSLTSSKGLGFTNGMDTGRWTREKRIKFDFNVIYNNKLYNAGEWIVLGNKGSYTGTDGSAYSESKWSNYGTGLYTDIYKDTYQFYCVLANYEAKAARIQVEIDAVNSYGVNDNKVSMSNRHRGTYSSLHGGSKELYVDIVGRIGNLTVHDTGDYRFSNFFKKAADTTYFDLVEEYDAEIVNNAVDGVYMIQGEYRVDIRGVELTGGALSILDGLTEWESIRNYEVIKYTPNEVSVKFNVVDDSEMSGVRFEYISNYGQYPEVSGIDIRRIVNDESDWVVDGVVRVIDESKQNHYMAYKEDIRGIEISNSTNYINTYGTQKWAEEATHVILPISSDKNNIDLLRSEPIRIGYGIYYDISTIGNYFLDGECELQLVPYYYALNTVTKELTPVDAYFKYSGEYHAANIFDIVNSDWKGEGVYNYTINLDWDNEKVRRNYTDEEQSRTDFLRDYYATGFDVGTGEILDTGESYTGSVSFKQLDTPSGSNYALGNTQFLSLNGKARTFIGGDTTYGIPKNLGGKLQSHLWWQSAQRWHLNTKLPSSSVFVRHKGIEKDMHGNVVNRVLTDEEIEEFQNGNYVVLCAVNIVVVGNTYMLKYDHIGYNGQVGIRTVGSDGVEKYINVILPDDIPPVIAVYSSEKSSILDVEIVGTH